MSPTVDPRLQRLLGGEALAALRRRLRRHFEQTLPDAHPGVVRLGELAPHEHAALASLLGRPPRLSNSMQIDIAVTDAALREAGLAASLRNALEQLDGSIAHLATARAETQSRWAAVAQGARHSSLAAVLQTPAGLGLLKRLARQDFDAAARLRDRAEAVLQRLPAGGLARAQLAAETLGDAHALDNGQAAAALVLAAWRRGEGSPASNDGKSAADDPPDQAPGNPHQPIPEERARDVWARAGVLVNELARPALVLNLPAHSADCPASVLGEPIYASLRWLLRSPPAWAVADCDVHVCENPNLLAIAADRLGGRCAPLVCTDGMPAAAQRTLLTQLAKAGARLLYHGDFDWPGLQIANHAMRTYGARPWRFSTADYEAALAHVAHPAHRLSGTPVTASWDAALAGAMQRHGVSIPEEGLAEALMEDLER